MVTANTTRPFRTSSPSFLSSSQLAKDCKISWSALQAQGCPAVVQRLPGEGVHLPGTSWCSQPGSERLILRCSPLLYCSFWVALPAPHPLSATYSFMSFPRFLLRDGSLLPVRYLLFWSREYWSLSPWLQVQEWSIDNAFWGCFSHDGVMLLMCNPTNWYLCSFSNSTNSGRLLSCHKQFSLCWVNNLFPDSAHLSICHFSRYGQKPFLTWKEI